jgi:hypothetical protein
VRDAFDGVTLVGLIPAALNFDFESLQRRQEGEGLIFMIGFNGPARATLSLAFGAAVIIVIPDMTRPALADPVHFIGGADDTDNNWENTDNWSTNAVPGSSDAVVVDSSNQGAVIPDGQSEEVQSLQLDGGLNVNRGGSLTVTGGITNNGVNSAYFINDGTVVINDGVNVGTLTNTYTHAGDADYFGYISNTHDFTGNLDNSGSVVNGDGANGVAGVTWTGDVSNKSTGSIINSGATWNGDVTDNAGSIYNDLQSTWNGDVKSNSGYIENTGGSSWSGDVVANDADHLINNIGGATWTGNVQSNEGSINNDGGTWNGNVLSNNGSLFNTIASTWNGDITSSGSAWLSGTVNGAVNNDGGTLYVDNPLSGVTAFTNTGALSMDDGDPDDVLRAQSWSGTGVATFDFAPGLGRSDHVVLSGDYAADTDLGLNIVGPSGRVLGDVTLIDVGGANTGTLNVSGLPDDGVISYRLEQSGSSWVVTTILNDAPGHAASAAALLGRATASATEVPIGHGCGGGRWARALGDGREGTLSGTQSSIAIGGVQVGYDFDCIAVGGDATLGFGLTAGGLGGRLSEDFAAGDRLSGGFGQGFGGLYGNLTAGPLRAVLQGQLGVTRLAFSDPQSAVEGAGLTTNRFDLGGHASYELALGSVSLTPEIGFTASDVSSHSKDFADVGTMSLTSGATLDAYAGATVASRVTLQDGLVFTPFVRLLVSGQLRSPATALFTDQAGGTATVPLDETGSYATLGLGGDLFRAAGPAGDTMAMGLRADFKRGDHFTEDNYGAYAQVKF